MVGVIPLVKSLHFAYKKKLQEILPKNGPYLLESITSPNFSTCYDHNYEPPQLVRGFFFEILQLAWWYSKEYPGSIETELVLFSKWSSERDNSRLANKIQFEVFTIK